MTANGTNTASDDFLKDLELPQRQRRVSNAVGRDLKQILEQRNSPAHKRGDVPLPVVQVTKMSVPRKRHEYVRENEKSGCSQNDWQLLPSEFFGMMIDVAVAWSFHFVGRRWKIERNNVAAQIMRGSHHRLSMR